MSIVLRNVKGTALTYEELDNNINQLIYSASIGPGAGTNTNDITLYYTGSDSPLLSPRTITLTVPATPASNLQTVTNVGSSTTNSITATSFVKTGGTVDQVLLGTGVTSPLILTPGSGTNSIQSNSNIYSSTATGNYSFAVGGLDNLAKGTYSIAAAGADNTASGSHSAVIGGEGNIARGFASIIGGGENHSIASAGDKSAIFGGSGNTVAASGSAVIGGQNNTVGDNHHHSSILAGNDISTTRAETAYASSFFASGSLSDTGTQGIMQLSSRTFFPTGTDEELDGMLVLKGGNEKNLYIRRYGVGGVAEWTRLT